MYEIIYTLLTLSLLLCNVQSNDPPSSTVRRTTNGYVQGIEEISSLGQKYFAFRSVPYAEPPITGKDIYTGEVVDRRFNAPEPLKRTWDFNLQVQTFQESCVESSVLIPTKEPTGEDCLYLAIYVPDGGAENKTVLVWLHGGGFTEGGHREALYGPDFLLAEDNVIVSVQYRLGIFGFLNLGRGEYTGNMGLKDQQMALKWINKNIHYFSGKPREVLLFGESAGGASTTFHMLNKVSRQYFKRAYAMSGTVFSYFALTKGNHVDKIKECSNANSWATIMYYMKTANASTIRNCYLTKDWGVTLKPEFVPTIEPPDTVNGFITESPELIWRSKMAPVMDTLFSFTSVEEVTFDSSLLSKTEPLIHREFNSQIRLPFDYFSLVNYLTDYTEAFKVLRESYYSDSEDVATIRSENIALMSDLNFGDSVLKAVKLQADANGRRKNTFLFKFGVHADLNWVAKLHNVTYEGAAHADELCYIFHCHRLDHTKVYDKVLKYKRGVAYKTIKRIVKTITNFARTGDPSIEGDTKYKRIESSHLTNCYYMNNDPKTTMTHKIDYFLRYDAWRKVEHIYNARVNRCYHFLCEDNRLA